MGTARAPLIKDSMIGRTDNPGIKREAALLEWIQQFAPYGVLTLDESFRLQSWNRWMEQHSGIRFEEVAGKSLFDLYPDLVERKMVGHLERALQGESSVLSTTLHRYLLPLPSPFRDTGVVQMLQTARISPLLTKGKVCGVVVVIEDVTQRERQANALERQHRRDELLSWALAHFLKTEQPRKAIRQLFFKIAEQLDFDTFLVYLRDLETGNLGLEAIGGVPPEAEKDFLACPFLEVLDGETHEVVMLNSVQTLQGRQYSALQKARISAALAIPLVSNDRNLGLLCFASWSRNSIAKDESDLLKTIAQYLATALDRENTNRELLSAQEQLSDHARLLESRVRDRTSRLQETISELETFSYTIAHDLKAPARAISGYCEIMFEDFANQLPEGARAVTQKIARASGRMEMLTRDLLEFSKVSREEIVLTPVEIEPIIEDLAALRVPAIRQAITIRTPLHPVRGHQGLLQHVFSNLVDNAVKFVRPGTVPKVTICSEVVSQGSPNTRSGSLIFSSTEAAPQNGTPTASEESRQHVRIWVRDEGIGIDRAAHQKIFGIFEQAGNPNAYEGTGIGLAIVARAVQRMGGTCGVESEPGKGSGFWVELPAG